VKSKQKYKVLIFTQELEAIIH